MKNNFDFKFSFGWTKLEYFKTRCRPKLFNKLS